jgi:hypothetical protein
MDIGGLPTLLPGRVAAKNALWIESPGGQQFQKSKTALIAEIQGPATITMVHFAKPNMVQEPDPKGVLNRDVLLKIYWDGEKQPSVDCPLVDFFCDPAGLNIEVNSALVNKRRGWNAYFPMPFRKSARIELVYDGPLGAGKELVERMPCYAYVMYRTLASVPDATAYFHAYWRQEQVLLGKQDYRVVEIKGKGKFVGVNLTVRQPGWGPGKGIFDLPYPVDENEKFYIDGEKEPSVEFQGLEDAFGFSWGFPPTPSQFPLTGWFPFYKGACAYRFFVQDAISFDKSLCVKIGFGKLDDPIWAATYGKPENRLQFSSTAYWYQTEPHSPLPPLPPAAERAPAPDIAK